MEYINSLRIDGDNKNKSNFFNSDYISGLFQLFKDDEDFCLKIKLQEICYFKNCVNNSKIYFYNPLIKINMDNLNLESLDAIISSIVLPSINYCSIHKTFLYINLNFEIIGFPEFLFFILNINFNDYKIHNKSILNKINEVIAIGKYQYKVKAIIFFPYLGHFTSGVFDLEKKY